MTDFHKVKKIKLQIYPFDITFCLLNKQGEENMRKKHELARAMCIQEGLDVYVYLRKGHDLSDVVHELFHATELIMGEMRQPLASPNNETWAYLLEYLFVEYQKFIKK